MAGWGGGGKRSQQAGNHGDHWGRHSKERTRRESRSACAKWFACDSDLCLGVSAQLRQSESRGVLPSAGHSSSFWPCRERRRGIYIREQDSSVLGCGKKKMRPTKLSFSGHRAKDREPARKPPPDLCRCFANAVVGRLDVNRRPESFDGVAREASQPNSSHCGSRGFSGRPRPRLGAFAAESLRKTALGRPASGGRQVVGVPRASRQHPPHIGGHSDAKG